MTPFAFGSPCPKLMSSHQRGLFPRASAKLLSSLSQPAPMGSSVGVGRVRLSDGAVLKLKILIVDVKEAGFSPFGGVSFDVKVVGGVAVEMSSSSSQRRPSKSPGLLRGFRGQGCSGGRYGC